MNLKIKNFYLPWYFYCFILAYIYILSDFSAFPSVDFTALLSNYFKRGRLSCLLGCYLFPEQDLCTLNIPLRTAFAAIIDFITYFHLVHLQVFSDFFFDFIVIHWFCSGIFLVSTCLFFPKFSSVAVVQSFSCVWNCVTPWAAARQTSLSFTISWSLLQLKAIESVMPSNHLILCCPILLLLSIFPGNKIFSSELAIHIRWQKHWNFSFSISPSNKYSGMISFRIDWFDLLAIQGTLKSLHQKHSSKISILQCSAFFIVQFSHSYMTTDKT